MMIFKTIILILLIQLPLFAQASSVANEQKTIFVKLSYDNVRESDEDLLGSILRPLIKNGFIVSLHRQILEEEIKRLEQIISADNQTKEIKEGHEYLKAALAQNTLQPTLPSLTPPSLKRLRQKTQTGTPRYASFAHYPWNWIYLGEISNRVTLMETNNSDNVHTLDISVKLVQSPTYSNVAVAGSATTRNSPDITITTLIGKSILRTSRIKREFKETYNNPYEIWTGVEWDLEEFIRKNINKKWFMETQSTK